ncbi:MAG TPA: hypothetical protein VFO17_08635 [Acidimicrobiia bacterium]|jgi:hypothetical protein|nr:hypothetical protein [Acidimicrobiia bacterium]
MDTERPVSTVRDVWRLLLAIIAVVAIVQELRKPKDERTWHGKVASFVPYDFRMPTAERLRETYWNPDGPVVGGKVFGVGWAPNFGALLGMFRRSTGEAAAEMQ